MPGTQVQFEKSSRFTASNTGRNGSNKLGYSVKFDGPDCTMRMEIQSQPPAYVNRCRCTRIKRHQCHLVGGSNPHNARWLS